MKYSFKHKGKKFEVDVEKLGFFGRLRGLMFRNSDGARALLFENLNGGIHSYFVFGDFLAVWLSSRDEVLKVERVKPWRFYVGRPKGAEKLVEVPVSGKYGKLVGELIGKV